MALPTGTITMLDIRNEFTGKTNPYTNYSSLDSDLYNMDYYRNKAAWNPYIAAYFYFSAGAITMNDFRGMSAVNPGDGGGGGGDGDGGGGGGGDGA